MKNSYFLNRKSIRKFKDAPVDDTLLNDIITGAAKAPTTGNMQLYSVIITRGKKERDELAKFHFSQPASTGAPVLLTVCADLYRFTRWCELRNANVGFDNFLSFLSAFSDAVIFAQQMATIAEINGLGTCYLGTVIYNAPEIAKLLELPPLVIPVASIALGWPDEEGVPTERLESSVIIHEETYRKSSDKEILSFYKIKEDFEPNKKFVIENGKENLAQVFAEVRYPKEMNENISEKLKKYLSDIGILNIK